MSIIAAFAAAHPPLAISEVGHGQEKKISATIAGYKHIADMVAELKPETIIVISPHSIMYSDYIHISPGKSAWGDMSKFRAPEVRIEKKYDTAFIEQLADLAESEGISAGTKGERDPHLDHGVLVPLYYVEKRYTDYELVRVSISGLSFIDHYCFGQCMGRVAEFLGRRTVVIASGDLSHKLKEDGPYGFSPAGPVYDERIAKAFSSADFSDMLIFGENFCDSAAECGHRSFIEMAGALDGKAVKAELMSHEGPYGVGYATASFIVTGTDESRHFGKTYLDSQLDDVRQAADDSDVFVNLARLQVESYVRDREVLDVDDDVVRKLIEEHKEFADQLLETRAGAFVSIHEHDRLRGCIGTISATCGCLAKEILQNAISASTRDPRFNPISADELPYLEISVDVLGQAEPIDSMDQLDVKRYGVIVSHGSRRGLLLPDLEGVDTPEEQVSIALQKAGISSNEKFSMERFEVVRHE